MKGSIFIRVATLSFGFAILSQVNGAVIPDVPNEPHIHSDLEVGDLLRSGLLTGVEPEVVTNMLRNMIVPSYMQEFLKLFENKQLLPDLLTKLFDGVPTEHCKTHATEWIWRVADRNISIANELNKWVLHMVDSWGKPPEGLLSGHVNAYGDFDECVNIKVADLQILNNFTNSENAPKSFEGRYCTMYIADYNTSMPTALKRPGTTLKEYMEEMGANGSTSDYLRDMEIKRAVSFEELLRLVMQREGVLISPSLGVCMPNSCSNLEIQQILINAFDMMYTPIKGSELYPEGLMWPSPLGGCYDKAKPDFDAADISVIALLALLAGLCLISGIVDYWLNHGVDKPLKRGLPYQYFMSFSLYTNIKKWLSTRRGAEDMGCLHGIRFLSTSWVVLAHTYYAITFLPQWNMVDVKQVYENWPVMTVINSTFAVDTFFVLSGMLVCYNLFKMFDKTKGKLNVPMFYVHRYLRLTPTYAILVGIMATIIPYLGNGPYWAVMTRWGNICENNWWTNLLYVNNFVNTSWLCQGEAWYLANDMQFYVVSPFIIYPMWKWEMMGAILLCVYTILSCACPILLVHFYDTTPTTLPTRDIGKWFTHIYIRPYARIQTFLVGVWLGWILYKTRGKKVKLPAVVVIINWALSTAICLTVLYSISNWFDPEVEIPKVAGLAYAGLSRVGWGVSISWVIFACMKGYGGLINSFLSWSVFMPLGRLCYCVYLVSLHLQMILHVRFTQPMRFDNYTQINFFFGHLIMSFIVGFFCTLLFESPFMILQKLIFEGGGGGGPRPQNPADQQRPSKRYGIFYNNADTIINAQVTEPNPKVSTD
ncbi:unnamed protein product [Orchesella dallaii]|uniref:Nose resistant-to-fluoxetine protein N-terminal domain-containing protein n=1 Tax=Orchesella dallaii TaxID=48710 RepID=A0ABP1RKN9_9HEXA